MNQSNHQRSHCIQIERIITFTVHSNPLFKCSACAKSFQSLTSYHKHRQAHTPRRAVFNCRKCSKAHSVITSGLTASTKARPRLRKRRLPPALTKSQMIREFTRYDSSTDESDSEL